VASGISLVETLRKHGICNFVFSSSAAVYGTPHFTPIPEEHPKEPVNAYGESKLVFERILRWYAEAYGWSVVAFRYFNACGGETTWGERHEPETHVIPLLLQAASGRRNYFEIFGDDYATPDGTCLRDYVHVLDIAEAHLLALKTAEKQGFRAYNIGTGQSYSVMEICRAAERITGKQIDIRTALRRSGDPAEATHGRIRLEPEAFRPGKHPGWSMGMGRTAMQSARCRGSNKRQRLTSSLKDKSL